MIDTSIKVFNKFKDGSLPWLELDLDFSSYIKESEFTAVEPYYVTHREGETHKDWESCCLHGLGIDKTRVATDYEYDNELTAPYDWTPLANLAPTVRKFWEKFPAEKYTRIRFMKLKPGGKIDWHNDRPQKLPDDICESVIPINVAVTNPALCYMEIEDHGIVPWRNGKVFLINILKNHTVVNNSNADRIHMIGTVYVGNKRKEFNSLLEKSLRRKLIK